MIRITDAEERVMGAMWDQAPSTLGEIAGRLVGEAWSTKTIKTLIDRLTEKGAVGVEKASRKNRYHALVAREEFARSALDQVADRLFSGKAHEMMAFFCRSQSLTAEQARELIELLERKEADGG